MLTFNRQLREGGYTFVTSPELGPGFNFMLEPNENDVELLKVANVFQTLLKKKEQK